MSVDKTVHTVCCLCIWTDLLFMSSVCAMRLAAPTLNAHLFTVVQVFFLGCVLRRYELLVDFSSSASGVIHFVTVICLCHLFRVYCLVAKACLLVRVLRGQSSAVHGPPQCSMSSLSHIHAFVFLSLTWIFLPLTQTRH